MKKAGIIGLGLIGGSIYKSLKALNYDVKAVSRTLKGISHDITGDYKDLTDRDIVFVCTPINKTLQVLDDLENVLSPETVVTDVCSLKTFVCLKERPYKFVPSHPMAGTEHQGFENSFEGLFKGAKWVLTPCFNNNGREILEEVIKDLGAFPIIAAPKEHDEAAAMISHMPMVIAQALFLAASKNPLALEIASSGFRDMTRLALSNEEMASDMVNMNAENIQTSLLKLYNAVGVLTHDNYSEQIAEIKNQRQQMFNQ